MSDWKKICDCNPSKDGVYDVVVKTKESEYKRYCNVQYCTINNEWDKYTIPYSSEIVYWMEIPEFNPRIHIRDCLNISNNEDIDVFAKKWNAKTDEFEFFRIHDVTHYGSHELSSNIRVVGWMYPPKLPKMEDSTLIPECSNKMNIPKYYVQVYVDSKGYTNVLISHGTRVIFRETFESHTDISLENDNFKVEMDKNGITKMVLDNKKI